MERVYRGIIENIARIYERYEQQATSKNKDKRQKAGLLPDKDEARFFEIVGSVIQPLRETGERMGKSTALSKNNEMKAYTNMVLSTAGHIESIRKKKLLPIRVNKSMLKMAENTTGLPSRMMKAMDAVEAGGGFCCGGNDGKKQFRNLMMEFSEYAANWRLIDEAEQRENTGDYLVHRFDEGEFRFVRDILSKNWPDITPAVKPQPEIIEKVVQKEKVVEKIIVREVETGGKPNRLSIANEWVYGINREYNPTLGLQIYHEEADKANNPAACNILGTIYQNGDLLPKDYAKAVGYYRKSMDMRDARGIYLYACSLEKGLLKDFKPQKEDLAQAYKLLMQSADMNCVEACVNLGSVLENGCFQAPNDRLFSVGRDPRKAMALYNKARNEGSPKASNNIGVFFLKNKYIDDTNLANQINSDANAEKNLKTACRYLQQSADRGFSTAFYNLATLYERGQGVPQSAEKARDLFYQGATRNDTKCKLFYALYLIDQTSIFRQSFEDEYRMAIRWLEDVMFHANAKEEQTAKAYYFLGLFYEYGFGVDQKPRKAVELFERAALFMHAPAINKLGHCYFSGFGVKADKMIAIGYYKQAAEQGNDQALVNLGTAYMMGIDGVLEKNPAAAYEYFEAAMKAGNTDAYVHLSNMYEHGLYVKKDEKLARQLLMMAAIKKNQTAIYMLNQRGEPIDSDIIEDVEHELFVEPKAIDPLEVVPYISDLAKASVYKR